MFGRSKSSSQEQPVATADRDAAREGAKGRPTPKRREAEQRNRRPVVGSARASALRPNASKEEKKAARAAERSRWNAERALQRQALMTGDDRHLPARDKGPAKRFARDYVDARWNAGELFLPAVLVIFAVSFYPSNSVKIVMPFVMWALFAWVIVDSVLLGRRLKRMTVERWGDKGEGTGFYGAVRAIQFRRARLPRPQVKRGEFPA